MDNRRLKYSSSQKTNSIYTEEKIDVKFDITELDLMCSYVLSENASIKRSNITNLKNLFNIIDMSVYGNDQERLARIDFILKGIEARLDYNLTTTAMIFSHICGGFGTGISNGYNELNNSEVQWVNSTVSETLKYANLYNDVDKGLSLLTQFKATDYANRGTIVTDIEGWVTNLQVKFRKAKTNNSQNITFSLDGEEYIQAMQETYRKLSSPSNRLIFGTQALNMLTGGGVEAGRVYTLLGLPGEGKSSTLADMAIELKRYNKNYKCKDPTKKPCVVLLIMENSVEESVQRIFNMCVGEDILNYSMQEAIDVLNFKGNLILNDSDPINLKIVYQPNMSVDTSYLYTLYEDLEDEGYEVICLIQDYIKRIRSVNGTYNGDLRLQLGAIIDEFKVFATLKNIPVITASQLNRTATTSIDDARAKNQADLVRVLGRANVGESNLILENSDWIALIAPEYDREGNKYLGIQQVKSRYFIPGDFYTAYIPYIKNTIKFVEDYYSPLPVHKVSMKEEVNLNTGINSTGIVNEVKDFTSFNDIKLPTNDMSNLFVNASGFASFNIERISQIPNNLYICESPEKIVTNTPANLPLREMCKIVSR